VVLSEWIKGHLGSLHLHAISGVNKIEPFFMIRLEWASSPRFPSPPSPTPLADESDSLRHRPGRRGTASRGVHPPHPVGRQRLLHQGVGVGSLERPNPNPNPNPAPNPDPNPHPDPVPAPRAVPLGQSGRSSTLRPELRSKGDLLGGSGRETRRRRPVPPLPSSSSPALDSRPRFPSPQPLESEPQCP